MSKPKHPKATLFCVDERLERHEVEEALSLAWQEIYLVEYDYLFAGFRGVHMNEEGTKIFITFQLGSGGLDNAAMVTLNRDTKVIDFSAPPKELIEKEIESLEQALGVSFHELEGEELADRLREVEDLSY
ncbi:MAG: hypothetical protein IH975_04215 [Nitrospinae bacterium]|nr:hypothetical protein [Nitrospinota bacterium]